MAWIARLLDDVASFDVLADRWHEEPGDGTSASGDLPALVRRLHHANFALWHLEDEARRPGADDVVVAWAKRAIDRENVLRNRLVEEVDEAVLAQVGPGRGPVHTETPGMLVDRLSVGGVRIAHLERALRAAPDPAWRPRLALVRRQQEELRSGLEVYVTELVVGERSFRLYKQFKGQVATCTATMAPG